MLVMSLSSISIKIIIEKLLSIRFPRDYVAVCFHRAGVVAAARIVTQPLPFWILKKVVTSW
ncbi:hypothetical protein, partial [uncultured Duncaniella sp.]|jgi:hypothetical protein|uniref:hypothetical protein n=1 Tax=uncultured Duncaniella sp. TaxID=2768039 RepID=UPI002735ACA2